jgi:CDP-glucose 4,6-dehydratase
MEDMERLAIYSGKKVLVTGHTGFKGAWLSIWLSKIGARVIGISLGKDDNDYVYKKAGLAKRLYADERADINDYSRIKNIFERHNPEIVFHLAAQPIVRASYDLPLETLSTNIIGTANVLEAARQTKSVRAAVMITTDKCYKNREQLKPYKEEDELGGYDPYSCSKACAELVIASYRKSFFHDSEKLVASARAGNVIGGGDFGKDRLVPDCVRSIINKREIEIRNPCAIRPWQFVLEPLYGYLLLGERLLNGEDGFAEPWNFGPEQSSIVPVRKVVGLVIKSWGSGKWRDKSNPKEKKHEAKLLNLDITKAKRRLGWKPKYSIEKTISCAVGWYKKSLSLSSEDLLRLCESQIRDFMK